MCPLFHHWAVDYCSNVRWSCEYLYLVVLDFLPLVLCNKVTSRVVSLCACVSGLVFIRGTPRSFVWVSTLCFVYVYYWSSSPCLYMARCNLGREILKTIKHSCGFLPILYTNVTHICILGISPILLCRSSQGLLDLMGSVAAQLFSGLSRDVR